ncbi:MAG: class I SAM-dependent methyltransferase [Nanoarchaeota archaeon]|nr:class I SAM-dependent methyltransferase [Nanoarchaeota archaeon]
MLARNELSKKISNSNKNLKRKFKYPFEVILPEKFVKWNKKWGAPYEKMFSYQANNNSRYFEYPWAFYAVKLKKGMNVLDFGGGLCGFQFMLSKCGVTVHNLDPGIKSKGSVDRPVNEDSINKLNKKFKTKVKLYNDFIDKANLPSNFYNIVYSISVFEHLQKNELKIVMKNVGRILKPGGFLVITLDLFPNIYPFTSKKTNRYGRNMSVKNMIELSGLKFIYGKKSELFGFKQFNAENILKNLGKYIMGNNFPVLIQTVILKKESL